MDNDPEADERLACILLCGFVFKNKSGLREVKYPGDKGLPEYFSGEEFRARAAIARLLRSDRPLSRDLRDSLASLFDSDGINDGIERKIVFRKRSTKQRQHMANTQIVEFVRKALEGKKIHAAITAAANHFGRGDDAVKKIWLGYRRKFKDLYGKSKKGK